MQTIYRLSDVCEITGLSKSTIYRMVSEKSFPGSVRLGRRSVGWLKTDLETWLNSRTKTTFQ